MKLSTVSFSYEIKDKQFSKINYSFDVLSDAKSSEQVVTSAKTSLHKLENILDNIYKGSGSKTEDGSIDTYSVDFGYIYSNGINLLFNNKWHSTRLTYTISMNDDGRPLGLKLKIFNTDKDQQRLMKVYDSVLTLPELKIYTSAQVQIDRINFLRAGNFDINTYLTLPKNTKK